MNGMYKKLIENLYGHLPVGIQGIINDYGPEKLYSLINPNVPYLDKCVHGVSYLPYMLASRFVTDNLLRIKKEDMDYGEMRGIGWWYLGLVGPFIEEAVFRYLPSVVGRSLGGNSGEIALLGASSVVFAACHCGNYKNKKFRGFLSNMVPALFLTHAYLAGGFVSSFTLHSTNNIIACIQHKVTEGTE